MLAVRLGVALTIGTIQAILMWIWINRTSTTFVKVSDTARKEPDENTYKDKVRQLVYSWQRFSFLLILVFSLEVVIFLFALMFPY